MTKVLGIDLGTTYSAMAVVDMDGPKIIVNAEGSSSTPSVVSWIMDDKMTQILVGREAKNRAVKYPETTASFAKRQMGKKDDMGKKVKIKIGDKEYLPEEISARILMKLKKDAEERFGEKITRVVVSVPAYFRDGERKATKTAAILAGWDRHNVFIVNEPNAAAMSYGLDSHVEKGKILVFDLGGGTFDTTILTIQDKILRVLTNGGARELGGKDFDERIVNYIVDEFNKKHGINLKEDKTVMQKIMIEAEIAKNALSDIGNTTIIVYSRDKNMEIGLTRDKFNELTADLVEKVKTITKETLKDTKPEEIDVVVMVGGCSRIPAVKSVVKEIFPHQKIQLFDPDLAIAKGAAIYSVIFFDAKTDEEKEIRKKILTSLGAGELVATHSLGIDAIIGGVEGKFSTIIKKDTELPAEGVEVYSTSEDDMTSAHVIVYEGEDAEVKNNHLLGDLAVYDIPPAKKGVEKIEVTFNYDMDNTVTVAAKVVSTGGVAKTSMETSLSVPEAALMAMKDDAAKDLKAIK